MNLKKAKLKKVSGWLLLLLAAFFFCSNFEPVLAATAPQITGISPANGPMTGGTLITITGSNFAVGATVYIGTQPASLAFISSTRIDAYTPSSTVSGKVDVRVINPDGQQAVKLQGFRYDPVVTEVAAETRSGSTVGRQPIIIRGMGFQNNLTLYIGTNPATDVTVSSDGTTITALTPPGTPGRVPVKVVNPDGGTGILPATDEKTFEYRLSQPQITNVSPSRGTWLGGTEVTIRGEELSPTATVRFGGVPATLKRASVTWDIATSKLLSELVVLTPRGAVGVQDVIVTNPDGQTSPITSNSKYEFIITPVIDSITPNYGTPHGGTEVTITGSNFPPKDSTIVTFGGIAATVTVVEATYLKVLTPPGAPGSVDVEVYDATDRDKAYKVFQGFTYVAEASHPTITSITPNSGSKDGGTEVTIMGSDFRSGIDAPLKVKFGNVYATQVTVKSTTELLVVTPPSSVTGPVDVTVENPDGGRVTIASGFTYLAPERVLLITSITPNQGSMEGNTPVTVKGANFLPPDNDPSDGKTVEVRLTIGGHDVQNLEAYFDSATQTYYYTALTPPGYGVQDVVLIVTTKFWEGSTVARTVTEIARLERGFTYKVPESRPIITKVEPTAGPLSGGTLITIKGSDFRAPKEGERVEVYIGDRTATNVQVLNSETIIALTPPSETTGLRDVIVINPDLATAVLKNGFTYLSSAMTVVSVTPDKGPVQGGTRITITGANFDQDKDELGNIYVVVELGTQEEGYLPARVIEVLDNGSTIIAETPQFTAGTKDVVVHNRFGRAVFPQAFTYYVPPSTPSITEVVPNMGPTTGGTEIWIYGERFQSKAQVTIGGKMAIQVEVLDTNTIRAVMPSGVPGPQDVVVINPDGGQAKLSGGFTYISHPVINRISPDRGSRLGGTIVTITGADFYSGMKVYFGSVTDVVYGTVTGEVYQVPGEDVLVIDQQTARVRVPAWPENVDLNKGLKVDIAVVNTDASLTRDGGYAVKKEAFTYCEPGTSPYIDRLTPNFGPTQGGNEVLITGRGFQPDVKVYFGWSEAQILEVTPNQIRVKAPAHSPGFYDVTVINTYDTGTFTARNAYEYRQPLTLPRITGVFPSQGPAEGGTLLVISGEYFWPGVKVFIGAGEARLYVDSSGRIVPPEQGVSVVEPLVSADGRTIFVHSPEGPKVGDTYLTGPVDVTVVNPDGGSANLRNGFTYKLPDSQPAIDSLNPKVGTTKGGTPVTITGRDFRPELKVYFGGVQATVKSFTSTAIEVVSPAHEPGVVNITVVNKDGGVATAYDAFEYRLPGSEPIIKSIVPNVGSVMGGTQVTLTGEDFRQGVKVYFGGSEALNVERVDYQTITAQTPPGKPGAVDVTVINPDAGSYTLSRGFTYQTSVPRIDAVVPERGPREGGIKVIIKGADFVGPVQVFFGTAEATEANVIEGGTMVEVALPAAPYGRLGTVDVKVINADGAQALKPKGFTYVVPESRPQITGINPTSGSTRGGNWVTITGEDFREGPQVFFGGQPALTVILVDSSTLMVKAPPHAEGPTDVTVTNYDGGTATLPQSYIYKVPESEPVIKKVEPGRGPQTGGTAITVTGLDFREGAKLYIGGALAQDVHRLDYRTLTAVTPKGAEGPAEVTVVNPDGGTYTLERGFTYYHVEVPLIQSVTPNEGPATGGIEITISGGKFAKGAQVLIAGQPAQQVERVSETLIKAITPPGPVGWQEVRVVNPDGGWNALSQGFRYLKPRGVPETPLGFRATLVDPYTIKLTWNPVEFANYYEIWVSDTPGGPYRFLTQTSSTTFYSTALLQGAGFFRVRAVNEFGYSPFSSEEYAEAVKEESSGSVENNVRIVTSGGGVEAVLEKEGLLAKDYKLELTGSPYQSAAKYTVKVAASLIKSGQGTLILQVGQDLTLSLQASSLYEAYRNAPQVEENDTWVEIILEDAGQAEAESLLKGLPRGSRVLSRVWNVKLQVRSGRYVYPQVYFPGGLLSLKPVNTVARSPVIYHLSAFSSSWYPVNSFYTAGTILLRLPGKYALVDYGSW